MTYFSLVLALALGYIIGLLQKGININDKREMEVPLDEEGKPVYNSSYNTQLEEEFKHWIELNRR